MISAADIMGATVVAQDVTHADGPFYCPDPLCLEEVVLKKGRLNVHHFAHHKGSDCDRATAGESAEHEALKLKIYRDACAEPGLKEVALERRVGNRIADVALIGTTRKIAVEVQISPMKTEAMVERMIDHRAAGFSTLWVVKPSYDIENLVDEGRTNKLQARSFHQNIELISHGTICVYEKDLIVRVFHFMGKDGRSKFYKHGSRYRICDLVDQLSRFNGSEVYSVVTVPNEDRWWQAYVR